MPALTQLIGFVSVTDPARARAFYGEVLGFRLLDEDDYALVFDAHGSMVRAGKAKTFTPAQGTVMGWEVEDIRAAVKELAGRGVKFEQWGLPFMKQDEDGVWLPGNGDAVAWFKDPEGNVLSISQHAKRPARG
ncbi:MAG TPA: VOC family protein [Polyangiaceae bacterium]|jgi:catechol 2,3-dioxygenase-like lactoylglutathione lyase family enzyme